MGLDQQARAFLITAIWAGVFGPRVLNELNEAARMWPTARGEDAESSGRRHTRDVDDTLTATSRQWATASARMHKGGGSAVIRKDGKSRLDLLDWQAEFFHAGLPAPPTTPAGSGCSSDGRTSPPQWRTPNHQEPGVTSARLTGDRSGVKRRLNPRFVEWLMGFDLDWTAGLSRTDRLRCLGNAVVPAQGAAAVRLLVATLQEHEA